MKDYADLGSRFSPKVVCFFASLLFLSSCASSRPIYKASSDIQATLNGALLKGNIQPTTGPSNPYGIDLGDTFGISISKKNQCATRESFGGGYIIEPTPMPGKSWSQNDFKEHHSFTGQVDAGVDKTIYLGFLNKPTGGFFGHIDQCKIMFNFRFGADESYEILGIFDTKYMCHADLNKLVHTNGEIVRKKIATFNSDTHTTTKECWDAAEKAYKQG